MRTISVRRFEYCPVCGRLLSVYLESVSWTEYVPTDCTCPGCGTAILFDSKGKLHTVGVLPHE